MLGEPERGAEVSGEEEGEPDASPALEGPDCPGSSSNRGELAGGVQLTAIETAMWGASKISCVYRLRLLGDLMSVERA